MIRARPTLYIPGNKAIASFTITEMNDGYTRYKVYARETTMCSELYKGTMIGAWRMAFGCVKAYYGIEYMLKELDGKVFVMMTINGKNGKVKRLVIDKIELEEKERFKIVSKKLIELLSEVAEIHSVYVSKNTAYFAMNLY